MLLLKPCHGQEGSPSSLASRRPVSTRYASQSIWGGPVAAMSQMHHAPSMLACVALCLTTTTHPQLPTQCTSAALAPIRLVLRLCAPCTLQHPPNVHTPITKVLICINLAANLLTLPLPSSPQLISLKSAAHRHMDHLKKSAYTPYQRLPTPQEKANIKSALSTLATALKAQNPFATTMGTGTEGSRPLTPAEAIAQLRVRVCNVYTGMCVQLLCVCTDA